MLLLRVLDRILLVDPWPVQNGKCFRLGWTFSTFPPFSPEVVRVSPEGDVELLEELVHPCEQRLGRAGLGLDGRLSLEDDDPVCQVGGHDEVVLHDEASLLSVQDEALDHLEMGGEFRVYRVRQRQLL